MGIRRAVKIEIVTGDAALGQSADLAGKLGAVSSSRRRHHPPGLAPQLVLKAEEPLRKNAVRGVPREWPRQCRLVVDSPAVRATPS